LTSHFAPSFRGIYRKPDFKERWNIGNAGDSGQEDVKKLIWSKSKLMQNVCRRPSDRLLGILARLFLEPKFPHTNFSISSQLPDGITPEIPDAFDDVG
jgi:hypothetical protein